MSPVDPRTVEARARSAQKTDRYTFPAFHRRSAFAPRGLIVRGRIRWSITSALFCCDHDNEMRGLTPVSYPSMNGRGYDNPRSVCCDAAPGDRSSMMRGSCASVRLKEGTLRQCHCARFSRKVLFKCGIVAAPWTKTEREFWLTSYMKEPFRSGIAR